mgnify:FL=1
MDISSSSYLMKKIYKLSVPYLTENEKKNVSRVLDSGWITSGPITNKLENLIIKKIKAKNVISVNSATSGIFISLIALGAKKGDEVITPSNTYISTINTLYNLGLKIKLCDVCSKTGNVDEETFKKAITKKTKFFIPVHNGGNPVNLEKIIKISKKNKIKLIDDAATAFGAKIKKKFVGSYNFTTTVFSLHANKIITSGEGGFVCTNNKPLAKKIRLLANSGLSKDSWNRKKIKNYRILNTILPGYKLNLNDILSSIAIEQIKKINKIINQRYELKKRYMKKLYNLIIDNKIYIPFIKKNYKSALYNFQIILKSKDFSRDKLSSFLQKKNIYTGIHYTPAHVHDFYRNKLKKEKLNNTNYIFKNCLSLPFHNKMSLGDVDFICKQINIFFRNEDKKK